ncbi:MAG: DUF87 domain-containing protein [Herpetosiphon sp.]
MQQRDHLGTVVGGSLTDGLTVRLTDGISVEDLRVGQFVVVQGDQHQFFCMISDVELEASNPQVLAHPPTEADYFLRAVLSNTATYANCSIAPMLMLSSDVQEGLRPVRTVPRHFAPMYAADEATFSQVFGTPSATSFSLGKPLDMEIPICLDLRRFAERSNGVFGKSGTGKSFLTRLLLCGVIKGNVASNLIFDMHSEYGGNSEAEDGTPVRGLRQLFGSDVMVYSLDPASSRRRNVKVDSEVAIGLDQIEVEDVMLLQDELNLTSTAAESSYLLTDRFRGNWLKELLKMNSQQISEFAEEVGGHAGSLSALKRKLETVSRLGFVQDVVPDGVVSGLVDDLARGKHVVLEFGQYKTALAYMLVANILTRRIHRRWVEQTEHYWASRQEADKPRPLILTIEEAHKFLNPQSAKQTIFGTIARELRKYSVTLLVVDQRPSAIDTEVMSQLGSRITALLNDERDIDAVFTGVGGASRLRSVLASLDSKQQAMILGHAVPMPVVVRTRPYDETFYAELGSAQGALYTPTRVQAEVDELFA